MPYTRDHWQKLINEAQTKKLDYAVFLENLLELEWQIRLEKLQARRIKEAKFPLKKYLSDFKRDKYDEVFYPKFDELETLAFIKNKENIILLGTSGAGKTHYAIALGTAACMIGKSVLFAHVPNLILELKETAGNNQMSSFRKRFEKYDLVILDELGYVSMDKTGCETLFNLISSRNEKGSIIATSNLTFDRWEEVFKDPTLTGALIDRLAHKAHVLDISREKGGRFEETLAWMEGGVAAQPSEDE
jgi:DNA replication protein DnaC